MHDFKKVTTKTGDSGETSLADGSRLFKSDPVFAVLGNLDELNSCLGVCRSHPDGNAGELLSIQEVLPAFMSLVSDRNLTMAEIIGTWPAPLEALEDWEAGLLELYPDAVPDRFIIPGGCRESAFADLARTVCRRAERSLVFLGELDSEAGDRLLPAVQYLNRLSDALFVYARTLDVRN